MKIFIQLFAIMKSQKEKGDKKMKKIKKLVALLLSVVMAIGVGAFIAGCSKSNDTITVITREGGSGTRGAFIELTGIEQKDEQGNKIDKTTKRAEVANQTSVVIKSVSNNKRAIGYISLGSLNDSVKAVEYEGVKATVENIKNGTYTLSRPFNVAYKEDNANKTLQDFLKFVKSVQAAEIIVQNDYISVDTIQEYSKPQEIPSEKLIINGSSSVYPLMEKLVEEYCKISGVAKNVVDLQFNDSSSGMTGTANGTYDLGMASRNLKDAESENLSSFALAIDGIAVIVNKENKINTLSKEQVRLIYTGEITKWLQLA